MKPLATPAEVLVFWFGRPGDPDWGCARTAWFTKDPAFDDAIRVRFGATVAAALDGACDAWPDTPEGALACLLLLDQFTRNIHRDTPAAFAGDPRALAIARRMVERGWDRQVLPAHRSFCYLPFEHSESPDDQRESLRLFADLQREPGTGDVYDWALRHQQIIERFGRFPHRNAILGRASTDEEIAFLEEPGSRF